MFKFNFDLDDIADDPALDTVQDQSMPNQQSRISDDDLLTDAPCTEIPLQELLDVLPSVISCSPITIPLQDGAKSVTLTRRDLFDARFQLIAEGSGSDPDVKLTDSDTIEDKVGEETEHRHASALRFIDAPSDLVPHVYEGGLKTWECAIDLVEYLDSTKGSGGFRGQDILELGCGTAVPSLYILHHLFSSSEEASASGTTIYLQDYNDSVLELVTLPNILLTWYLSSASLSYRTSRSSSQDFDSDELPFPTTPEPFELPITSSLKSAFLTSLKDTHNISIRFFSGSWSSLSAQLSTLHPSTFDLVLTSETIYRMDSLPSLVETMRLACLSDSSAADKQTGPGECLVAAKVLYFGVGGGISEFVEYVTTNGMAKSHVVSERKTGVGRVILSLNFH